MYIVGTRTRRSAGGTVGRALCVGNYEAGTTHRGPTAGRGGAGPEPRTGPAARKIPSDIEEVIEDVGWPSRDAW